MVVILAAVATTLFTYTIKVPRALAKVHLFTCMHKYTHQAVGQHGLVVPRDCVGLQRASQDNKLLQSDPLIILGSQVLEKMI